jgi:Leucine-rich repeat (LRR) protein
MDIAHDRIKECIELGITSLNISYLGLESLPLLPASLQVLNCSNNQLKELPATLREAWINF